MPGLAAEYPTIISFAAGAAYYHDNARRLAAACDALGLDHSIDHIEVAEDMDWVQLCRLKVQFYRKKLQELGRPVLWVDADSELVGRPEILRNSRVDFAAIMRRGYISKFDPYLATRTWNPQVIYFGDTPVAREFLDHLCEVDSQAPELVTDDYSFQEAWNSFDKQMSITLIPGEVVAKSRARADDGTWVIDGSSGNVREFQKKVLQHSTVFNRGFLLGEAARDAMRGKDFQRAESLLLAAKALYGHDTAEIARRLAHVLREQGRTYEAKKVLSQYHSEHPHDSEGAIAYSKELMRSGAFTSAERLLRQVEETDPELGPYATSLLFDLRQERKAKKIPKADRPKVWWMKQPYPGNLGDILNPYLVEKLTGIPPRMATRGKSMLAIGSVIKFAQDGCHVWGTGTPRMTDVLNPKAKYHAVRGPLTRDLVLASGGECPEIYGDPALLMPLLYNPVVEKKYKLGIIRHVRQRSLGILGPGVRDINLLRVGFEEIEAFVRELLECEMVVSTSLHGLILAHAYGIPARWAEFVDTDLVIQGDGTKYRDYFSSVGLPVQEPLLLAPDSLLDESLIQFVDPDCSITFDAEALLASFPGELLEKYRPQAHPSRSA